MAEQKVPDFVHNKATQELNKEILPEVEEELDMVLAAAGMNNGGAQNSEATQHNRTTEVAAKHNAASQLEQRRLEQAKKVLAKQEKELAAREHALKRDEQRKHNEVGFRKRQHNDKQDGNRTNGQKRRRWLKCHGKPRYD